MIRGCAGIYTRAEHKEQVELETQTTEYSQSEALFD